MENMEKVDFRASAESAEILADELVNSEPTDAERNAANFIVEREQLLTDPNGMFRQDLAFTMALKYGDDYGRESLVPGIGAEAVQLPGMKETIYNVSEKLTGAPDFKTVEFLKWYDKTAAKLQDDFRGEMRQKLDDGYFVEPVRELVRGGVLPEVFYENAWQLEEGAPNYNPPVFFLFDTALNGGDAGGKHIGGYDGARHGVGVNMAFYEPGGEALKVAMLHELTHAIAGPKIDFGDPELTAFLHEGLTEAIARLVEVQAYGGAHDESGQFVPLAVSEVPFGAGGSYAEARGILKQLQSGGTAEVPPKAFYEAYASLEGASKLFAELKKAFPEGVEVSWHQKGADAKPVLKTVKLTWA